MPVMARIHATHNLGWHLHDVTPEQVQELIDDCEDRYGVLAEREDDERTRQVHGDDDLVIYQGTRTFDDGNTIRVTLFVRFATPINKAQHLEGLR